MGIKKVYDLEIIENVTKHFFKKQTNKFSCLVWKIISISWIKCKLKINSEF